MKVTEIKLQGCFMIEPTIFDDGRGVFFESFNQQKFNKKTGIEVDFVQDNQSVSQKGVLRGLHFQKNEFSQAKLVRVIKGKVLDIVLDLRKNSKTFGKIKEYLIGRPNAFHLLRIPPQVYYGFKGLHEKISLIANCADIPHFPDEVEKIDINNTMIPYQWS